MAIEYWYPNGNNGAWADSDNTKADEGINGPGLDNDSSGIDDTDFLRATSEGSALTLELGPAGGTSAITAGDTVTQVRIFVRATRNSGDTDNNLQIDFAVSGVPRGGPQETGHLTTGFVTYTLTDAAWNADWTDTELAGAQVILTTEQGGMPSPYECDVSEIEVEITYTASTADNPENPGGWQLALAGKPLYFLNSNDNKLFLTGQPVVAGLNEQGIVRPLTVGLTVTPDTPFAIGAITPDTATLTYAGIRPTIPTPRVAEPTLGTIAYTGAVPEIAGDVIPGTASLTISELTPARWTGLWFEADAPAAVVSSTTTLGLDGISLLGFAPDVAVQLPSDQTRIPEVGNLSFASTKIVSSEADTIEVSLGTVTIQERLTNIFDVAYPAIDNIGFVGYAPKAIDSSGQVIVEIGGPYEQGTIIRNTGAEADAANRYNICARSGYRAKPGELVKDGYGEWVLPEYADRKHPSDLGQGSAKGRYRKGALRPSDIGSETFIDPDNPVSADDL